MQALAAALSASQIGLIASRLYLLFFVLRVEIAPAQKVIKADEQVDLQDGSSQKAAIKKTKQKKNPRCICVRLQSE